MIPLWLWPYSVNAHCAFRRMPQRVKFSRAARTRTNTAFGKAIPRSISLSKNIGVWPVIISTAASIIFQNVFLQYQRNARSYFEQSRPRNQEKIWRSQKYLDAGSIVSTRHGKVRVQSGSGQDPFRVQSKTSDQDRRSSKTSDQTDECGLGPDRSV